MKPAVRPVVKPCCGDCPVVFFQARGGAQSPANFEAIRLQVMFFACYAMFLTFLRTITLNQPKASTTDFEGNSMLAHSVTWRTSAR